MSPMLLTLGLLPIPPAPHHFVEVYHQITTPIEVRHKKTSKEISRIAVAVAIKNRKAEKVRKKRAMLKLIRSNSMNAYDAGEKMGISSIYARELLKDLRDEGKVRVLTGYTRYVYEATKWR